MILTYYPDTDILDVNFRARSTRRTEARGAQQEATEGARTVHRDSTGKIQDSETETYDADPSGKTLAHYRGERLEGLTIEYASRRAPEIWEIESLRREAAEIAATTGRVVESVTRDLLHDRTSFQTGELGPQSTHTSDEAVREYNQMIDEIEPASAATPRTESS